KRTRHTRCELDACSRRIARSDDGDRRRGQPFALAAHGEQWRWVVGWLQPHGIGGFAEPDIGGAVAGRGSELPFGVRARVNAGEPRRTAATRQLRKRFESRTRIAEATNECAKGARPDILTANQAEPIDTLLVGEGKFRVVAVVHNAPG